MMGTELEFVQYVIGQLQTDRAISYRQMFGVYTVYCNQKVVGLICDNQLFIKITEAGKSFAGEIPQGSPYPGAKLAFLIDEQLEDNAWLTQLVEITEQQLPIPKPKKKKPKKKLN